MKNVGKFFALIALLAFGTINANASCIENTCESTQICDEDCVISTIREALALELGELVSGVREVSGMQILLKENKYFSGQKYIFMLAGHREAIKEGTDTKHLKKAHCAAVVKHLPNKADGQVFCSYGINEEAHIDFKDAYFTIVFENNDFRNRKVYKNYTTFKFIDDDFYLYQYSREYFKAGDKKGQFVLDKTDIFYRQPRDDKNKSVLIPISAATQQFRDNLEKQCYKNGKCKE